MSNVNVEAKRILAKLLATENITVIHAGTKTASFDPKNRILTLPIWKNMSGDIYDLLVLHEVSHALHTPQGSKPLTDACIKIDPEHPSIAKHFLNVVEDARIERLIKIKYPGGKGAFIRGYRELVENDFFGIRTIDINTLGVIDRLNIYFKTMNLNIKFNDIELEFIKEIETVLTFGQVVEITQRLYEYAKLEHDLENDPEPIEEGDGTESVNSLPLDDEDDEDDINIDPDAEDINEEKNEKPNKGKETSKLDKANKTKDEEEDKGAEESEKESLECITDQSWEKTKENLCDENARPIRYLTLPKPRLDKIIVPYKQVHSEIRNFFLFKDVNSKSGNIISSHIEEFDRFKEENKPVVNWLVKEFELNKSAKQYARVRTSKTGILDLNRLSQYKFSDDIMKSVTTISGGKNHFLEIFVDWSGSVKEHILGIIHQVINIAMFARRINIPYNVYTFGTYQTHSKEDLKNPGRFANLDMFFTKEDDFAFYFGFSLRQILSNKMSASEFNDACVNLLMMASGSLESEQTLKNDRIYMHSLPPNDCMGGTPLNETIVTAISIVNELQKKTNGIVNTIFITDGEATTDGRYVQNKLGECYFIDYGKEDVYLRDSVNHLDYQLTGSKLENTTQFLNILKNKTNINIVGFFVVNKPNKEEEIEIKKNGYILYTDRGYDEFYIIPGGRKLKIHLDKPDLNTPMTNNMMVTTMTEYGLQQKKQRVMLTRFIKLIS
jgi:hypothetical protein